MSQATLSPRRALLLAALLRVALLAWGAYQDAAPHLPDYSDVDLDVFLAGTRALAACPRSVLLGAPRETYAELAAPLEGAGACAEGYLAALARFLLQLRAHVAARPDEYAASELSEQLLQLSFRVVEVPATLLALAGNPYAAPTFRYSPLLALLLAPALLLPEPLLLRLAPRLLFAAADLLCGVLMLRICRTLRISQAWVAPAWLLNPFVAQISTRGSAESLLGLLVLGWLDATLGATTPDDEQLRLARRQQKVVDANVAHVADAAAEGKDVAAAEADASDALLAADASSSSALSALLSTPLLSPLLLALATHFKLVPAMYALPLALHLAAAAPTGARVGAVLRYGLVCAWATAAIGLVLYGM
jgi:phosphatidylinositol glycan class M